MLAGNGVYAACQWGMIVALAKLGSSFMVGQFSLGLAIAGPVLMFANLHLRAVQATDARRAYSFSEYLRLRTVMTAVAMVVIVAIACFGNYESRTAMVILAVAAAKGIETLSDIHYGLFQLNDRLDQTGRSMMVRGVLSVFALSSLLYLTRDVVWGCAGLALVWLAALLLFDVRWARRFLTPSGKPTAPQTVKDGRSQSHGRARGLRRQWSLLRLALPLGIVTTIATVNLNMPRYFIHARMGDRELGIYSAVAYATVALTLVSDSLGHCAIPRMSRLYAAGEFAQFRSLLFRLLAAGSALGLAGLTVAHFLGWRLLALFYSPEYAARYGVFTILMFATAIHCVASVFTTGIMSTRRFGILVPIYALVVGANALACGVWVPASGLAGGAMGMIAGSTVHLVTAAAVLGYLLLAPARTLAGLPAPRLCADRWEGI
jgi:O-antigen/teichoic acid export membrane protein